jgi:hypothetical protein
MGVFLFFLFFICICLGVVFSFSISTVKPEDKYDNDKKHVIGFHPTRFIPFGLAGALCFVLMMSFVTVEAGNIGVVKKFGDPVAQMMVEHHIIFLKSLKNP